jgi:chloride channel 3/4/5
MKGGADKRVVLLVRLADEPDAQLGLMPEDPKLRSSTMSIFSFAESYSDARYNPYDIARYIDRVSYSADT